MIVYTGKIKIKKNKQLFRMLIGVTYKVKNFEINHILPKKVIQQKPTGGGNNLAPPNA